MKKRRAKPAEECIYPRCESCEHYVEAGAGHFCNVPMVISKQEYIMHKEHTERTDRRIYELEESLFDVVRIINSPHYYIEGADKE